MMRYQVFVWLLSAIVKIDVVTAATCLGRCGDSVSTSYTCQCNNVCKKYGDCCSDYNQYCETGTCLKRCGEWDSRYPCNCDDQCTSSNDCCGDYQAQCVSPPPASPDSCAGKCYANYDPTLPCQCNTKCPNYGNCCKDYSSLCNGQTVPPPEPTKPPTIPADISAFATAIWKADVNRANVGSDVILNYGSYISNSYNENDISYNRLFVSVNSEVLQRPTYKTLIKLFDNYITSLGSKETKTWTERNEEDAFMNAIFNTAVMKQAYQFVKAKKYFSESLSDYKDFIRDLLFKHYSRKGSSDSSGFEHVFVGEWSGNSAVSGFHNWVQMYLLEKSGDVNYHGYMRKLQHNIIKFQFKWSNRVKPVTSTMIGASPEFEVALFSTCFLKNPNSVCEVKINGQSANIQTYDHRGDDVFGSAYFIA